MNGCYFVIAPIVAVALLSASFGASCRAQDAATDAEFSIEEAALGALQIWLVGAFVGWSAASPPTRCRGCALAP